jgi:polyhydroxyalkanoate synthesis repressor PhaR
MSTASPPTEDVTWIGKGALAHENRAADYSTTTQRNNCFCAHTKTPAFRCSFPPFFTIFVDPSIEITLPTTYDIGVSAIQIFCKCTKAMANSDLPPGERIQLRRYPNRRYYDSTRSCHVTLEAVFQLIREGHDVEITDSKTGEDITAKVLTQIILEHDPPKLEVFPTELLHQLIRANEPVVRDFVDKYFSRAFAAFVDSQQQFNDYLREALGLGSPSGLQAMMMGPFAQSFFGGGSTPPGWPPPAQQGQQPANGQLEKTVEELQKQVQALREELDRR